MNVGFDHWDRQVQRTPARVASSPRHLSTAAGVLLGVVMGQTAAGNVLATPAIAPWSRLSQRMSVDPAMCGHATIADNASAIVQSADLSTLDAIAVMRRKAGAAGVFVIHSVSCTGPSFATLAPAARKTGQSELTAALSRLTAADARDLCIFATGDLREGQWAPDQVAFSG